MSSWISSSFSTPQNQKKKQMARHKVRPLRQDRQDRLKFFEMTGVIRTIISKPGLKTLQERNLYSQGTVVHLQALFYSKFEISYFKKRNLNQIIE